VIPKSLPVLALYPNPAYPLKAPLTYLGYDPVMIYPVAGSPFELRFIHNFTLYTLY